MSALAREATQHLAAVKAAESRIAALRHLLSLFDAEDDRLALRALAVDGEQHGFTYGDLRALVALAESVELLRHPLDEQEFNDVLLEVRLRCAKLGAP